MYLVGLAIGAVFAVRAPIWTRLERGADGNLAMRTGGGFVISWYGLGPAGAFVWTDTKNASVEGPIGGIVTKNQLLGTIVAPPSSRWC